MRKGNYTLALTHLNSIKHSVSNTQAKRLRQVCVYHIAVQDSSPYILSLLDVYNIGNVSSGATQKFSALSSRETIQSTEFASASPATQFNRPGYGIDKLFFP
uniref:Uncharacterized protein n=1 Tax=Lygus hesperus TaxID=30085 RepID=A0A146MA19_LYGHE